jgi:potassium/hydrogen antiporter
VPDLGTFGVWLAIVPAAIIVAVLSTRLSARIRVPAPALFLIAAAVLAAVFPQLSAVPRSVDEEIVTVALIFVLFDGGMHIGWSRFRRSAGPIVWLGLAGTAVTAAGVAAAAHFLLGLEWPAALLLGAALSPTDPAVVFSVLGGKEISGRSGTILEGESGANDPVGISLLVSILAATAAGSGAVWSGVGTFLLQMVVGAAVGIAGGLGLSWFMRRVSLPNESLYLVRTIACAVLIYAVAALIGGSGFLAVFLAGILTGDTDAPFKREVERFSSGIASLAEIVVFAVLGLTVSLGTVLSPQVLLPGLILAGLLIFVVRPVFVGLLTLPLRLRWGERAFVLWAGLKGAVPILLGMFILSAAVPHASTLYSIVVIVVVVSVLLQGSLVPWFAKLFTVPMTPAEPEPWAAGTRLTQAPDNAIRHTVEPGSPADGATIQQLDLGDDGWVSMITRDGRLLHIDGTTRLEPGDAVLILTTPGSSFDSLFAATS